MIDSAVVQELVRHHYPFQPVALEHLRSNQSEGRVVYRIQDQAGQSWVLRLQHRERSVPAWFGGGKAIDWFRDRANLLLWLTERGYPAPRLMRTHAQMLVCTHEDWCGILTSFYVGTRLSNTGGSFELLAESLGRLHAIASQPESSQTPLTIQSWWHPFDRAVGYALRQLTQLSNVPQEWQPLHAACQAALHAMNRPLPIPTGCIHGDCWTGNAIRGPEGAVHLIDWDAAGLGPLVLDFGALLGDCFRYPAQEVAPDTEWIAAVVDTYMQYRELTSAEIEALPEAIRFGPAFRAAIRFSLAEQHGWQNGVIRGLSHEQGRLAASTRIARAATARLIRQH